MSLAFSSTVMSVVKSCLVESSTSSAMSPAAAGSSMRPQRITLSGLGSPEATAWGKKAAPSVMSRGVGLDSASGPQPGTTRAPAVIKVARRKSLRVTMRRGYGGALAAPNRRNNRGGDQRREQRGPGVPAHQRLTHHGRVPAGGGAGGRAP